MARLTVAAQFGGNRSLRLEGPTPTSARLPLLVIVLLSWSVTAGVAAIASLASPWLAAAAAGISALVVLSTIPGAWAYRLGAASLMLTAGLAPVVPIAALALGGALAAGALLRPVPTAHDQTMADLQRHVARSRRLGEPTWVMALRLDDCDADRLDRLRGLFRVTDGVLTVSRERSVEALAVLHGEDFSPEGLECRIVAEVGRAARIGWAQFGPDGMALDVLAEHARAALDKPPAAVGHGARRLVPSTGSAV